MIPVELFGRKAFPVIGERPYLVTLGSHVFYWFALQTPPSTSLYPGISLYQPPKVALEDDWESFVQGAHKRVLEEILPDYLVRCRWFGGKERKPKVARIVETFALEENYNPCICIIEVEYDEGESERYALPLVFSTGDAARDARERGPERVLAQLAIEKKSARIEGLACDAIADPEFERLLLEVFERRRLKGEHGDVVASLTRAYRKLRGPEDSAVDPRLIRADQSNSSVAYGDKLVLKMFRRLDEGINPDLELGRFLLAKNFGTPELAGGLEYQVERREPTTLAIIQGFVEHQGDASQYTCEELKRFFERVVTKRDWGPLPPMKPLVELLSEDSPTLGVQKMIGAYLDAARLLGRRTAELHLALVSGPENAEFSTEPYSSHYQRSMYQSMRNVTGKVFRVLKARSPAFPQELREAADRLLASHDRVVGVFEAFLKRRIGAVRMRCHGDLHLGQFLFTGKDFVIIDFEGESARPLSDRRRKRSALRDVASMSRSFHSLAMRSLLDQLKTGALGEPDYAAVEPFANVWHTWSSWSYLKGYLETAGRAPFVPKDREELRVLLDAFRLEKALSELEHALHHAPEPVEVPLHGIEQILALSSHA